MSSSLSHPSSSSSPPPKNQLAQGRHVKFLKMGKTWDMAMHPWAFPFVRSFLSSIYLPTRALLSSSSSSSTPRNVDLAHLLPLTDFGIDDDGRGFLSLPLPSSSSSSSLLKAHASFHVSAAVCNGFGSLHGVRPPTHPPTLSPTRIPYHV